VKPAEQPAAETKAAAPEVKPAPMPAPEVKTPEQLAAEQKAAAERLAARQAEEAQAAAQKALDKAYLDAAKKGNVSQLTDLLAKGAALLANDDGNTALFYAAQHGRRDAVDFLLDQGIPFDVKNRIGSTPLTGAAGGGHKEVAWELYLRGGDPNEKNLAGTSALGYARSAGYPDMIELLNRPREVVEVSFARQTGGRTLQEIFNFTHQERLTLIRKGGEAGPVEAIQREGFDKVTDDWRLREAFKIYKKRGGTITEAAIFPRPPEPPPPAKNLKYWIKKIW
jgi:hypothetical protein